MVKAHLSLLAVAVTTMLGCETQRYQWNLTHEHLSPRVRTMSESDIREITRLVSRQCGAPIICITRNDTGRYAGEVWVTAGNQTTMEFSDNGLFRLKKQNGVWRVIDGGYGLSTSLIDCGDT
jgi:hypothetical protein